MEARRPFTAEEGIKVQTEQLKRWESVLKPEVFKDLKEFAIKTNGEAETGYDIVRGINLDGFVSNYSYNKYHETSQA